MPSKQSFIPGRKVLVEKNVIILVWCCRSILRTYAHDDVSVGSWFIGLDVKHIDERKLCCVWSSGLSLSHFNLNTPVFSSPQREGKKRKKALQISFSIFTQVHFYLMLQGKFVLLCNMAEQIIDGLTPYLGFLPF